VQERRRPTFLKKNVGAVKDRKPYGSRKPKNVRERKQAISFLGSLNGKTLKHTKTTEAEK